MLSPTTFSDELEREKARQRTYDAMSRKARAGHVTGGRVFGYRMTIPPAACASPRWCTQSDDILFDQRAPASAATTTGRAAVPDRLASHFATSAVADRERA